MSQLNKCVVCYHYFRNNHCDEKLQALLLKKICSYQFLELINYNPECLFHNIFMKTKFSLFQMISDLNTYLHKAVPDTRLTIKKYLDGKFEYLVSCFWIFVIWYRFELLFKKNIIHILSFYRSTLDDKLPV